MILQNGILMMLKHFNTRAFPEYSFRNTVPSHVYSLNILLGILSQHDCIP